jgi:hypothetical protein
MRFLFALTLLAIYFMDNPNSVENQRLPDSG